MCNDITIHDHRRRRCPRLGHELEFSYCRLPGQALPCTKIFDCWWETFDVAAFMREHFSPEQIERIGRPAKDKALALVELIEQARKRNNANDAAEGNGS